MDYGDILGRAWRIVWKHKALWLVSMLPGLATLFSVPTTFIFNPTVAPVLSNSLSSISGQTWFPLIGSFVNIVILILMIPFSIIALSTVIKGVARAEAGTEKLPLGELLKDSLPYFWRILGLMLMTIVAYFIVIVGIELISLVLAVITLGIGLLCILPLLLLLIPGFYLAYALLDLSYGAIVVDNLGVFAGLGRGWEIMKKNFWPVVLITLIVYVGMGILIGILLVPLFFPLFFVMFSATSQAAASRSVVLGSLGCVVAFLPFYIVLMGAVTAYMRSIWTLTYLRLSPQTSTPVPVAVENA
ncbi:MAG TPA: hypothetical protein VMC09_16620 [Anaerolineales bacterium]|nr:hypothetical protein [Anaerolineales bacterium]